jgi:hypothetical protein
MKRGHMEARIPPIAILDILLDIQPSADNPS